MTRLSVVDQNKLGKLDGSINGDKNGNRESEVNKDLPLNPDEIAGLSAQKRNYTKELEAANKKKKKPEVDPNHPYPDFEHSTTLILTRMNPHLSIDCGPLLKYACTDYKSRKGPLALYTMLLVTNDTKSVYSPAPVLEVAGINTEENAEATQLSPEILHKERGRTFWRWKIYLNLNGQERRLAYNINGSREDLGFWVPAANQSMRMVFHSCNGFSQAVDPDDFSGPDPLWTDVLRQHQNTPWHVMLGGGDQIYCDGLSKRSKLFKAWLQIDNLHHKFSTPYTVELQNEIEEFYLEHYCEWFHQGQFSHANAQIPMQNIFDDHDIIDGFGSYPSKFMQCPVFSNLGRVAFKYYLLFQHQTSLEEGTSIEQWDKGIVFGSEKGPYIRELSRSVVTWLGKDVLFMGIDNRVERTRYRVNYEATYTKLFNRVNQEIVKGQTKHLIIMLGIPIAYPRLVWLETILTSRIMGPIKLLARMGMFGGLVNKFDGGIEILDDLDDHWTAKHHKKVKAQYGRTNVQERNVLIQSLQQISQQNSVRITILGGDVHLGAVGQFYSNKKLNIPLAQDHRYMANIISSAIVNTPPSETVGDLLHRRNKVHHLDADTDEDMVTLFMEDVDGKTLNNKHLLPRRNWCAMHVDDSSESPHELDIVLNVEINCKDPQGKTKGYGVRIPMLTV